MMTHSPHCDNNAASVCSLTHWLPENENNGQFCQVKLGGSPGLPSLIYLISDVVRLTV